MPRLLILNNYPFEDVWKEVQRQEKPDHHLYGINHLKDMGYEIEIIPFRASKGLNRLNELINRSRIPVLLGDLDQEWSTLRRMRKGDIIYAPCQTQTALLSYLRAFRLLSCPIINLIHHPLEEGKFKRIRRPFVKLFLKGSDAVPSLSSKVSQQIGEVSGRNKKSIPTHWGPDLDFYAEYYLSQPKPGRGVIAAGRTGRDFETFGKGASQTSSQAHIICLEYDVRPSFESFGPNVHIRVEPNTGYLNYRGLLQIFAQMRVLAIPLQPDNSLAGLTSLTDALGMGKPVIMTRHPLIDIDIEAEGIGKWVERGDVEGWRDAIQYFEDNEAEALEMGQRARKLAEEHWNSFIFSKEIDGIIQGVMRNRRR